MIIKYYNVYWFRFFFSIRGKFMYNRLQPLRPSAVGSIPALENYLCNSQTFLLSSIVTCH